MNDPRSQPLQTPPDGQPELSRLVLTGFMGAGKSTVGALIARALDWQFLDLDAVIEGSSKLTVAEIFRLHGEARFRDLERQAVQQLIHRERLVLALGGGTVEDDFSRSILIDSSGTCLVFLEGALADLIARCSTDGRVRPLLTTPEALEVRHSRRLPYYRQAHVTVLTTGLNPKQVAGQVIERVSARWRVEGRKKVVTHGKF